ncbi:thiamine-phosphate pyrophosphorylase [Cytobacillus horneckiae]|uniref:Thiamine-phosphate synthase n=1 Tax=Cytobacillus horneckiae TaxID=549687 RepID=A0A2N0ZDX9_9BACI|nr:thiamine phosphate synthase [Cytobacillus horneckiae]MBN6886821.1 thiamine phosphate synthase [Cytobacillus horneckiae]MCM3177708.1 thiamine phosphate synthase [Cytobacillus horneckiae]MEC1158023.1 thiamine phosphate synthase [Cytobacillus horneckiae]MED2937052.1 thiamine phosphate synthase [Cytobacillus horneckiae]PKG27719.1 thiamine phosphate synthase [Cytobacillus horneckiae]
MKPNYNLYLVTEESVPLEELLSIVDQAIKGGVSLVQLREKASSGKSFFEKAKALNDFLVPLRIPLIINDRIDIALAVGAAGIHVGQDDMPLTAVKSIVNNEMIVGVSVSTLEEAKRAERDGADYVGIGSVFPTSSKNDAEMLSEGALAEIMSNLEIPAVAIGGIQQENIGQLKNKGLAGVSVVSAIMRAENPQEAAANLVKEWHQS